MTTDTTSNRLVQMADDRRKTLKLLARSANVSHRWATASAGAAIAHLVAAAHALVQARDLCEEGGWLRCERVLTGRSAQRSAICAWRGTCPVSKIDATRVSHRSQAAVLRAIRGAVFTGPTPQCRSSDSLFSWRRRARRLAPASQAMRMKTPGAVRCRLSPALVPGRLAR